MNFKKAKFAKNWNSKRRNFFKIRFQNSEFCSKCNFKGRNLLKIEYQKGEIFWRILHRKKPWKFVYILLRFILTRFFLCVKAKFKFSVLLRKKISSNWRCWKINKITFWRDFFQIFSHFGGGKRRIEGVPKIWQNETGFRVHHSRSRVTRNPQKIEWNGKSS